MTRKECVLTIEGYRPDGPLDAIVVNLDAAVSQKELQAVPVFGAVGHGLAEWRLCRDTGTVMDKPGLHLVATAGFLVQLLTICASRVPRLKELPATA